MNHIDIAPDRIPNKLIPEHLRRIKGKDLQSKGLVEMFDETLTDMYNCVPVSYCLWTGKK